MRTGTTSLDVVVAGAHLATLAPTSKEIGPACRDEAGLHYMLDRFHWHHMRNFLNILTNFGMTIMT